MSKNTTLVALGLVMMMAQDVFSAAEKPVEIEGELFVVPNLLLVQDQDKDSISGALERHKADFIKACKDLLRRHGVEYTENEPLVQIWATSPGYIDELRNTCDDQGSANWASHGHPHVADFPSHLPLSLFCDSDGKLKKDGDVIEILYNNRPHAAEDAGAQNCEGQQRVKLMLTLAQNKHRYAMCGRDSQHREGDFGRCIQSLLPSENEHAKE